MTAQERQEKLVAWRNNFTPITFNFVGKPDEKIPFKFTYMGDDTIQCIEPDCTGCTTAHVHRESNTIEGVLHLNEDYKAVTGQPSKPITKHIKVWFEDGKDWYIIDENGNRKPNPEKVHVPLYLQGQVDLR
jgi:hypothetical protein